METKSVWRSPFYSLPPVSQSLITFSPRPCSKQSWWLIVIERSDPFQRPSGNTYSLLYITFVEWAQRCLDVSCNKRPTNRLPHCPSWKIRNRYEIIWKWSRTVELSATRLTDKHDARTPETNAAAFNCFICRLVSHSFISFLSRLCVKKLLKQFVQVHEMIEWFNVCVCVVSTSGDPSSLPQSWMISASWSFMKGRGFDFSISSRWGDKGLLLRGAWFTGEEVSTVTMVTCWPGRSERWDCRACWHLLRGLSTYLMVTWLRETRRYGEALWKESPVSRIVIIRVYSNSFQNNKVKISETQIPQRLMILKKFLCSAAVTSFLPDVC